VGITEIGPKLVIGKLYAVRAVVDAIECY